MKEQDKNIPLLPAGTCLRNFTKRATLEVGEVGGRNVSENSLWLKKENASIILLKGTPIQVVVRMVSKD